MAPLEGAWKVTLTPLTGVLPSFTSTLSGVPKVVATVADCGVPVTGVMPTVVPIRKLTVFPVATARSVLPSLENSPTRMEEALAGTW